MAFEQVVPVVPQGMFSVITLKVPAFELFLPQWSCGEEGYMVFVNTACHIKTKDSTFQKSKCLGRKVLYLDQCVFTVSTEAIAFAIKSDVMTISINRACCQAGFSGALPLSVLTCTAQTETWLNFTVGFFVWPPPPFRWKSSILLVQLITGDTYQVLHFTLMLSPGLYVASLWMHGHSSAATHPPWPSDTNSLGHMQPEMHCVLYCNRR